MSVILMRRAVTSPITAPRPIAAMIWSRMIRSSGVGCGRNPPSGTGARSSRVVPTAIAMPSMPIRLPPCEVDGEDSPRKAKMKHTPETR